MIFLKTPWVKVPGPAWTVSALGWIGGSSGPPPERRGQFDGTYVTMLILIIIIIIIMARFISNDTYIYIYIYMYTSIVLSDTLRT